MLLICFPPKLTLYQASSLQQQPKQKNKTRIFFFPWLAKLIICDWPSILRILTMISLFYKLIIIHYLSNCEIFCIIILVWITHESTRPTLWATSKKEKRNRNNWLQAFLVLSWSLKERDFKEINLQFHKKKKKIKVKETNQKVNQINALDKTRIFCLC